MSLLVDIAAFSATYVAGCLTGHTVVTKIKAFATAEFAKLHTKLDALIAKTVNTSHPLKK
jgi:hypothetical protein